ncbi:MAG: uroporphyrinogen-III synthase [Rhizobiales bacterium]|nr:uroporphyrinogen-III synthase [Hyphomicrobiales bacterium]
MRIAVTRPQVDGERTATALRARGHEVLIAPLMRVEPIKADFAGRWGGIIITSANAPATIADNPARDDLIKLPVYTVGRRSAEAARQAGFSEVTTAGGDVRDLVRLIAERHADVAGPLLYLAGEDRAADLIGELGVRGTAAEMRVVYRALTAPFPPQLIAALKAGEIDAVLHFSKRSADNYLSGAGSAGVAKQALAVKHLCLSAQIAAPLTKAGAVHVAVAVRPDEAALIDLVS